MAYRVTTNSQSQKIFIKFHLDYSNNLDLNQTNELFRSFNSSETHTLLSNESVNVNLSLGIDQKHIEKTMGTKL